MYTVSHICAYGFILVIIKQPSEFGLGSSKVSPQTCIHPRMHPRWRHWGLEVHARLRADLQADYWNDAVWHLKESLALQKTHQHCKRERGMHSTHNTHPNQQLRLIGYTHIRSTMLEFCQWIRSEPPTAAYKSDLLIKPSDRNHLKCLAEKTLIFTPNNTPHSSMRIKIINRLIIY